MLSIQQLFKIVEGDNKPNRFWVDTQGKKHTIHGSVNNATVGGFSKVPGTKRRKYFDGEALYYKV